MKGPRHETRSHHERTSSLDKVRASTLSWRDLDMKQPCHETRWGPPPCHKGTLSQKYLIMKGTLTWSSWSDLITRWGVLCTFVRLYIICMCAGLNVCIAGSVAFKVGTSSHDEVEGMTRLPYPISSHDKVPSWQGGGDKVTSWRRVQVHTHACKCVTHMNVHEQ